MRSMAKTVTLTVGKDEALVLFELLADFHEQATLPIDNGARAALWRLGATLEKCLVEPFYPDYLEILADAKKRLREFYGLSSD